MTKAEAERDYRQRLAELKEKFEAESDMHGHKNELRKINSEKTINDTRRNLKRWGVAAVVRPTGFGKSYLLAHLSQDYNKSLYVYPRTVIKNSVSKDYAEILNNVDFKSYRELLEMEKRGDLDEFIKTSGYELIMLDEVHMAGAKGTMLAMETIKNYVGKDKIHLVGVTATPDRSDNVDVLYDILNNRLISEFTLHDSIKQGLMYKPHYVQTTSNIKEVKEQLIEQIGNYEVTGGMKRGITGEEIKQLELAVNNVLNASEAIKQNITAVYGEGVEYLKFITFFPNIETLKEQAPMVRDWFNEAFPTMKINVLIITSENPAKLDDLDKLERRYNTIDLVLCIDMINMGYHVNDITGVVMMRGTRSDIIYYQQMGRCLSVTAEYPAIIFDFVDNLHTKPYYQKDGHIMKSNGPATENGIKDTLGNRMASFEKRDLIVDNKLADLEDLARRIAKGGVAKEKYKEIQWWYESRKAPLFVLQEKFNISRAEVIRILTEQGVNIEDELYMRNKYSSTTSGRITRKYYVKKSKEAVKNGKSCR